MQFALTLDLPQWVRRLNLDEKRDTLEERMAFVLELARRNVSEGTGGPFGAAIFEMEKGRLVSVGVNRVAPLHCSSAHAEIMAIMLAQQALKTFDLGGKDLAPMELVSSTAPCAMCLGATPWSGVRRLVCGARAEDAETVGFDEGSKPTSWQECLRQRGIEVVEDVLREEAAAVLKAYQSQGGLIYNARRGE